MRKLLYKYIIENEKPVLAYQYFNSSIEPLYVEGEIIENYANRIWEDLIKLFNAYFEYRETEYDEKWYAIVFPTIEQAQLAIDYLESFQVMNQLTD